MNRILVLLIIIIAAACSSQKKLQKLYIGKPLAILEEEFGKPTTIIDQGNEKVYIFETVKNLESTEVSQGKLTLDPMITPSVKKTIQHFFTIKDGKIINVKIEEEYER